MEYNFELFNAVTDALEALEAARDILIKAQQNAENIYVNSGSLRFDLILPQSDGRRGRCP
jgi:hypothetical protein